MGKYKWGLTSFGQYIFVFFKHLWLFFQTDAIIILQGMVVQLTTSLVNVSLKFQTLISEISQYVLLKNVKILSCCKQKI